MSNIVIMTDSTCDLNEEDIVKYDIKVIPLYVNFLDKSYKDNVDITTKELYEMVDKYNTLPKTSAISVLDFINYFKPYLDEGKEIIYTGISSYMSSTYNNALLAVKELEAEDKIFIVDSKNLSTGIGLILLHAARLREQGLNVKEIVSKMNDVVPRVRSQFVIDTFDFLYKGGRCGSMAKIFGTMLKIKPFIAVRDGQMMVAQKPIGHKKAMQALLDNILKNKDNLDLNTIMITHSFADDDAIYLKEELLKHIQPDELMITKAGCVISSHCGKGTIGILYILNE
ncbi:MAG: DegV family protein [Anaeroplasmataceae bacterium]